MSSVYYSDDIRNNCESCEDFDTFIDECVDSFIDRDGPEAMAYDVPEFIAENVDEYDDSFSRIVEISTDEDGDVSVHYSSDSW